MQYFDIGYDSLTWINFDPSVDKYYIYYQALVKFIIHSQTSTMQPLELRVHSWYVEVYKIQWNENDHLKETLTKDLFWYEKLPLIRCLLSWLVVVHTKTLVRQAANNQFLLTKNTTRKPPSEPVRSVTLVSSVIMIIYGPPQPTHMAINDVLLYKLNPHLQFRVFHISSRRNSSENLHSLSCLAVELGHVTNKESGNVSGSELEPRQLGWIPC